MGTREGKESGIEPKFDCVKSFVNIDAYQKFSTKYGLESEIVTSFCESFATHVDLPKEKWFKYHPPIKEPIKDEEETIIYNVDPVFPTARNMLKFQQRSTKVILEHLNQLNKSK